MTKVPYGNAVGSILFLVTASRPDIAFAVSTLCRFIANPGPAHWRAVQHLFRYLQGTKDMKLVYSPTESSELFKMFCDADYGGNKDNGCSTSAYLVCMGTGMSAGAPSFNLYLLCPPLSRFFWLQDVVESGRITPIYIRTDVMPADALTKPLTRAEMASP